MGPKLGIDVSNKTGILLMLSYQLLINDGANLLMIDQSYLLLINNGAYLIEVIQYYYTYFL